MLNLTCNGVDWVDSKGRVQTYRTRPECYLGMISSTHHVSLRLSLNEFRSNVLSPLFLNKTDARFLIILSKPFNGLYLWCNASFQNIYIKLKKFDGLMFLYVL